MTTMIFVHGISVRRDDYDKASRQIETVLKPRRPDVVLARCLWGDRFGASLKAEGVSIPGYSATKGLEEASVLDPDLACWQALYADPLYELRLLALRPPTSEPFDPLGRETPSQGLDERTQGLVPSGELARALERAGIDPGVFSAARSDVTGSAEYADALDASADSLEEFRFALARAVVVRLLQRCPSSPDAAPFEADLRDQLVTRVAEALGPQSKGLGTDLLFKAAAPFATRYLLAWRGHYTDLVVPFLGDVLRYQGNGRPIRDLVRTCVQEAAPPVVLLGHSLGGIACVDLLAEKPLPGVRLLVTVGSQAPLLYEMDGLHSLRYGAPLPEYFPDWLNIWDRQDFLSYVGEPVFKDPRQRIKDQIVNNRQPFPQAHGEYWRNRQTWDAIIPRLP